MQIIGYLHIQYVQITGYLHIHLATFPKTNLKLLDLTLRTEDVLKNLTLRTEDVLKNLTLRTEHVLYIQGAPAVNRTGVGESIPDYQVKGRAIPLAHLGRCLPRRSYDL